MNNGNNRNQKILASSLFKLCSEQKTGSLFILSHCNNNAQFVLKDGEIIDFSFSNKHSFDAVEDFKNADYSKSHFIEDYYFPLTKAAKVSCNSYLLHQLGYNYFLVDQNTQQKNSIGLKCFRPDSFNIDVSSIAA